MRAVTRNLFLALILSGAAALGFSAAAYGQTSSTPPSAPQPDQTQPAAHPETRSPGGDVGSGAGDLGKGAGGAAGNVGKGVGEGAGDLVTLHPARAGETLGKGVGKGAKDAGVGVGKGTGKIAKGTGRGIGHLFHHSHKDDRPTSDPPTA
jgi:hypothetical protein